MNEDRLNLSWRRIAALGAVCAAIAATALAFGAPDGANAGPAPGVPGSAGVEDPFYPLAGNGGYDVSHYDIKILPAPNPRTRIETTIDATVDSVFTGAAALTSLNLDYVCAGPVDSVVVNGQPATYTREGQEFVITPAVPLLPGSTFQVAVEDECVPRSTKGFNGGRTGWVGTDEGKFAANIPQGAMAWFPSNNHPTDKATYRIQIEDYGDRIGISNGKLVSRKRVNGRSQLIWVMNEPMSTHAISVAIGRFKLDRGRLGSLNYLTAVDSRVEPTGPFFDYVRKMTAKSLKVMKGIAGPYPFSSTGAIFDIVPDDYANEGQGRPFFSYLPDPAIHVYVLAHDWYGNSVSPATWDETWLIEGLSFYSAWLALERWGDRPAAKNFNAFYKFSPKKENFWNPPPANLGARKEMYRTPVYFRAAMALHVLRVKIGDRQFFKVMRRWPAEYAYSTASTEDFLDLIAGVHGSVPKLFKTWLYKPGKPPRP